MARPRRETPPRNGPTPTRMTDERARILARFAESPSDPSRFEAALASAVSAADPEGVRDVIERHAVGCEPAARRALWRRAIHLLEELLNRTVAPPERARILVQTGVVWEEPLGRADQALVAFEAAYRVDRENRDAIEAVRRIQADRGDWRMVARTYQQELQVERDKTRRVALLLEAANVQRRRVGDEAAADRLVAEARQLDPTAAAAVEGAPGERRSWRSRLERLESGLYGTRGGERASRLVQIAAILVDESDESGALTGAEAYLREALALAPGDAEALLVRARLERARGDIAAWETTLRSVASHERAPAGVRARAELQRIALEDRRGDAVAADAALARALELVPGDAQALGVARDRWSKSGQWRRLADALAGGLRAARGRGLGRDDADAHAELGRIFWHELGALEEAEPHFRRVRLARGRDREMLEFYVAFAESAGDWERALATLRALRDVAPSDRRRDITERMAAIAANELGDVGRAVDFWAAAHAEDPDDATVRQSLSDALRETGRWNRWLELQKEALERNVDEDVDARIGRLLEMAEVYVAHFDLPALVANTYAAVLELDPAHEVASHALAQRYVEGERWGELLALLRRRAEHQEPQRAAQTWKEIARVEAESLNHVDGAAEAYERALELVPGDAECFAALRAFYEVSRPVDAFRIRQQELDWLPRKQRLGALRALLNRPEANEVPSEVRVALLQRWAEEGGGEDAAEALEAELRASERWTELIDAMEARGTEDAERARAVARLRREHLPDPVREAALWRSVLRQESADREALEELTDAWVRAGAWDELEWLAGEYDEWGRLVGPLRRAAKASSSPALYRRLAQVTSERLNDRPGTIEALERALELDPTDVATGRALENEYDLAGDTAGRVAVLRRLVQYAQADDAVAVRYRLAGALMEGAGAAEEAYAALVPAFDQDPTNAQVRERTNEAAIRAGQGAAWLQRLKRAAASLPASARRTAIYLTIADVAEEALGDPLEAADYLERVRSASPDDGGVLRRLGRLYEESARWADAADVLRALWRVVEGDEKVAVAHRVALAECGPLGRSNAPLEVLSELGVDEPYVGYLRRLREQLFEHERWEAVVEVARAERSASRGAADIRAAWLAEGVASLRLDREDAESLLVELMEDAPSSNEALAAARAVVERDVPLGVGTFRAAASVLSGHRQWTAAVAAWSRAVDLAGADDDLRQVARVHEVELSNPRSALAALLELTKPDDADAECARALAERCGAQAWLAERWASHPERPPASIAACVLEEQSRLEEARAVWRRIFDADPTCPEAVAALERLNRALARDEDLADHLIAAAEQAEGGERADRLREAAALLEATPGRELEAIPLLERALELDDHDLAAYDALERVYTNVGDSDALMEVLRRKVAAFNDRTDVQSAAFRSLGDAIRAAGGDSTASLHAYRRALDVSPLDEDVLNRVADLITTPSVGLTSARRREASGWVTQALYRAGDVDALVEFLERRVEVESGEEALALHRDAARVAENHLRDPMRAFHHWAAVIALGSPDEEELVHYARLGAEVGAEAEVVAGLEGVIRRGGESQHPARDALVDVLISLGEREDAIRHLESVVATGRAPERALEQLEQLYRESGAAEALAATLLARADILDGEAAERALAEAAQLFGDVVGDAEREADSLSRLQAHRPTDVDLLRRLERLLERLERWEDLTSVLGALSRVSSGIEAADHRLRRAMVLDKAIGDVLRAIAAYRSVLELRTDDRVALERLDTLYGELGLPEEQASLLLLRARVTHGEERDTLRLRLARLRIDALEDAEGAVALLREILEESPAHPDAVAVLEELAGEVDPEPGAVELLVEIHRASGDFLHAVGVVLRASETVPRGRRLGMLQRASRLYEEDLREPEAAFEYALQAMEVSRGGAEAVDRARRLAAGCDGWDGFADALVAASADAVDPERRVALLVEAGKLFAEELVRPDMAEDAFKQVLRLDPTHVEALRALDAHYEARGEQGERAGVMDALIDVAPDATSRLELLHQAAVLEDADGHDDRILERYRAILRVDPLDATALARLRTLLRKQEDWDGLDAHLESMVAVQGEPLGRARLLIELAAIRTKERGVPDLAVAPLVEALRVDLRNPHAHEVAESVRASLGDAPAVAPLLDVLAERCRANHDWNGLERILVDRVSREQSATVAAALWAEVAEVRERELGDRDGAFDALSEQLVRCPHDVACLEEMARLAEAEWCWERFCDRVREAADGVDERATRLLLLERVADAAERWLGDPRRTLAAYNVLFDEADDPTPWLDGIVRAASRAEDWVRVAHALRVVAWRTEDPLTATKLLRRSARVADGLASRPDEAIDALADALALGGTDAEETRTALIDLLGRHERWDALAQQLVAQMREGGDVAGSRARLRLAWLRLDRYADSSEAVSLVEPLLDDPDYAAEAFDLIASVLRTDLERQHPSPAAQRAAELAEPVAADRGRDDVLVAVYATRARVAHDPRASAAALVATAAVHARSGRAGRLELLALREALALCPEDEAILEQVRDAANRIGDATLYRRALVSAAGDGVFDDAQAALYVEAARAAEQLEQDVDLAVDLLRRVLDARPDRTEAAEELERLSGITGDRAGLRSALRGRLAAAATPAERVDALSRLAAVLDDDDEELIDVLIAWVDVEPRVDGNVARLESLSRRVERDDGLEVALRARATAGDRQAVTALARLRADELDDVSGAIHVWRDHGTGFGEDLDVQRELAKLYRRAERWQPLADALERVGHATGDSDERRRARLEIAEVRLEHLGEPAGALSAYVALLSEWPDDAAAVRGLNRLLANPETAAAAARALEPAAATSGDHERRLELLDVVLANADNLEHQVELALRMAEIAARDLGDLERAFEFASIAIRLQPTNALALHRMRTYAEGMEELERLASQLEDAAETAAQPSEVAWLNRLAGDLWQEVLHDPERAIRAYRRAAEARPEDPDAAHLLEASLRQADRFDELRDALGQRAERVIGRERVDALCQLADLAEERGDTVRAATAYAEALRVDPRADAALDGLVRLASLEGASDEARDACVEALDAAGRNESLREFLTHCAADADGARAATYWNRLGALSARVGDTDEAARAYLAAMETAPSSGEAFRGAAEFVRTDTDVRRFVEAVEAGVGALRDPSEQYARLVAAGRALASKSIDPRGAEHLLRDAIAADPDGVEAIDLLETLLLDAGRLEDALAALAECASLAESAASKERTLRRRVELAREKRLPPSRIVGMLADAVHGGAHDSRTLENLVLLADDITWRGAAQALHRAAAKADGAVRERLEAAVADVCASPRRDPDFAVRYWQERARADRSAHGRWLATLESCARWEDLVEALCLPAPGDALPDPARMRRAARIQAETLGDPDGAAETYRQVLALRPDDADARQAYESRMRELGRLDEVIDLLREELESGSADAEGHHLRIAALEAESEDGEARAVAHIDAALLLDPTSPAAVRAAVELALRFGDVDRALAAANRPLSETLEPSREAALRVLRAEVLERRGENRAAMEELQRAFDACPTDSTSRERLASRYTDATEWSELQRLLYRAASSTDVPASGPLWLRLVRLAVERLKDADVAFTAALEAARAGAVDARGCAALMEGLGDEFRRIETRDAVESGIVVAERAHRRDDLARLLHLRSCALATDDPNGAREAAEAAYAVGTAFLPNLLVVAAGRVAASEWDSAAAVLDRLAVREPELEAASLVTYLELTARTRRALGQPRAALRGYRRLVELCPERDEFLDAFDELERELREL